MNRLIITSISTAELCDSLEEVGVVVELREPENTEGRIRDDVGVVLYAVSPGEVTKREEEVTVGGVIGDTDDDGSVIGLDD